MTAESNLLSKLAESLADGESIDWDALGALAVDDDLRALLDHLRVVAGVAETHRSQMDAPDGELAPPEPVVEQTEVTDGSQRWGHLALVKKIGEGAFGEVYLAHDTWLDHPRALKLLKPEVANRLSPPQLLYEARKLVRVRHPNVVTVHGADRHDGRVGFWMDFVDGQTLAERVDEGCLSADEATYIGRELCHALTAVHQASLIHRDIKAQNVMCASDDGRVFLMDFGAGEFMGASPGGRPQGTPLYLAPELFAGAPATVQSDIYAVGVLLYHLVTGSFPVQAGSVTALIEAHGTGTRLSLRDEQPVLPERFVAAVERALDPDPARRFASADELRDALTEPVLITIPSDDASVPVAFAVKARSYAVRGAVGLLAVVATMGIAGFLAWRAFDLALRVGPEFAPPIGEYFRLGRDGVLPFFLYWLGGGAGFAILRGVDFVLGAPVAQASRRWLESLDAKAATKVAAAICLAGGICWVVVVATHWELFDTLFSLPFGAAGAGSLGIGPRFKIVHMNYSNAAGWLTFALVGLTLFGFPALERRCPDGSSIRPYRWTAAMLVFLIICSAIAPRRLAWDGFELMTYENRRLFVIASRGDDLLLYAPERPQAGSFRVHRNDAALVDTRKIGRLVDP